jgi:predicted RND superfamily exporter protein
LTIIGFFTFAGHPLDFVHSVIYVVLVGLSVDYVVSEVSVPAGR